MAPIMPTASSAANDPVSGVAASPTASSSVAGAEAKRRPKRSMTMPAGRNITISMPAVSPATRPISTTLSPMWAPHSGTMTRLEARSTDSATMAAPAVVRMRRPLRSSCQRSAMAPPLLPAAEESPWGGKDGIRRIISADATSASTIGTTKTACRPNRSPMNPPAIGPIRLPMRVTPPVVASARPRSCGEAARLIQARRASIHAPWQPPMPSSSAPKAGAASTSAAPAQQPASATPAEAWSRFSPKRAQARPIGTAMTMPPRPCRAKAAPAPANPAPSSRASSGMNGKTAATPADSSSTGRNTGSINPRMVARPGIAPSGSACPRARLSGGPRPPSSSGGHPPRPRRCGRSARRCGRR